MNYVNFTPIIDVSSIVWDEKDFKLDRNKYYDLGASVTTLFKILENKKLKFLLRNELVSEITGGFPIDSIKAETKDFNEFYGIVQSFFSNIDLIPYPESVNLLVQSTPNIKKDYFECSTKDEIQHLITQIHNGDEINKVYLTFNMLWNEASDKLITADDVNNEIKHERIISDDVEKLQNFLKRFELKFEHNEKHERNRGYYYIEGGRSVSPLSCYYGDNTIPQKLLDNAIKVGDDYFNYDFIYEVYVRFKLTIDNIYHAHDISDETAIPEEIISEFSKSVTRGKGIDGNGKWIGK